MNIESEKIENKLKSIILKNVSVDHTIEDIDENTDLITDLFFTSVEIIQLVVDIEDNFNIQIEDDFLVVETISKYKTLKDYVILVIGKEEK